MIGYYYACQYPLPMLTDIIIHLKISVRRRSAHYRKIENF